VESRGFWQLGAVSDARLQSGLVELLTAGYRTEARIVAHLAEVEQRKLHLRDGCASLFEYCTQVLRLSNSEAFHRITAARIARRFPIVFDLLERRQLHLTAVCLLRDYVTPENHERLLAEAAHKTKWQVQELLAHRFPRPDVRSRMRKLPASAPITPAPEPQFVGATPTQQDLCSSQERPAPHRTPRVPLPIEPLSEARYRIQLNASAALKEKLDRLRALLSHSNPSGDIAIVIERALDVALERLERRRFGCNQRLQRPNPPSAANPPSAHFVQTKRTGQPSPSERALPSGQESSTLAQSGRVPREEQQDAPPLRRRGHIPRAVLREVVERDGLQCSYQGANGCRCTAQAFLQVHHERPWARGGRETVDNLRLLCAAHNRLLAERDFGARHVEKASNGRRKAVEEQPRSDRPNEAER